MDWKQKHIIKEQSIMSDTDTSLLEEAFDIFRDDWESSLPNDEFSFYFGRKEGEKASTVWCKLRERNNLDYYKNVRSFETEELEISFVELQHGNYRHGTDFIIRPCEENRKDLMMYQ